MECIVTSKPHMKFLSLANAMDMGFTENSISNL